MEVELKGGGLTSVVITFLACLPLNKSTFGLNLVVFTMYFVRRFLAKDRWISSLHSSNPSY